LDVAESKCPQWFQKTFDRSQLEKLQEMCSPKKDELLMDVDAEVRIWKILRGSPRVAVGRPRDVKAHSPVWVCAEARGLQFKPNKFGISLVVTDILVRPEESFPFQSSLDWKLENVDGFLPEACCEEGADALV
jgi:hypothetical protein